MSKDPDTLADALAADEQRHPEDVAARSEH